MYANGQVAVKPLPPELHGSQASRILPLRRIEKVLDESEVKQHIAKEIAKVSRSMNSTSKSALAQEADPLIQAAMRQSHLLLQVPSILSVQPQLPGTLQAGEVLPPTKVSILTGGKQKIIRGSIGGKRSSFGITQRLWLCPAGKQHTFQMVGQ